MSELGFGMFGKFLPKKKKKSPQKMGWAGHLQNLTLWISSVFFGGGTINLPFLNIYLYININI
jgi:hypothetical protein